jgi:hypothetical protein
MAGGGTGDGVKGAAAAPEPGSGGAADEAGPALDWGAGVKISACGGTALVPHWPQKSPTSGSGFPQLPQNLVIVVPTGRCSYMRTSCEVAARRHPVGAKLRRLVHDITGGPAERANWYHWALGVSTGIPILLSRLQATIPPVVSARGSCAADKQCCRVLAVLSPPQARAPTAEHG